MWYVPWSAATFGESDFDFKTSGQSVSIISISYYISVCLYSWFYLCFYLCVVVMFCVSAHLFVSVSQPLCISFISTYLCVCLPFCWSCCYRPRNAAVTLTVSTGKDFNMYAQYKGCLKIYTKASFPLYIHCTGFSLTVLVIHYGVCMFRPYTLSCNNTPLP